MWYVHTCIHSYLTCMCISLHVCCQLICQHPSSSSQMTYSFPYIKPFYILWQLLGEFRYWSCAIYYLHVHVLSKCNSIHMPFFLLVYMYMYRVVVLMYSPIYNVHRCVLQYHVHVYNMYLCCKCCLGLRSPTYWVQYMYWYMCSSFHCKLSCSMHTFVLPPQPQYVYMYHTFVYGCLYTYM